MERQSNITTEMLDEVWNEIRDVTDKLGMEKIEVYTTLIVLSKFIEEKVFSCEEIKDSLKEVLTRLQN